MAPGDREAAIVNLLRLHDARAALVFCSRREAVGHLAERLAARGFAVAALSGALNQRRRSEALAAMRDGRARVCVATDVAARGIDLPGLDLVLHADLPGSSEMLLHRSGRTGRAGRGGLAVLVVPRQAERRAAALAARAGVTIDWIAAPDRADVLARDLERMLADPALAAPLGADDAPVVARLSAAHEAGRLAAAYGRLWSAGRPSPVELTPGRAKRRRRGAGLWFAVALAPEVLADGREVVRQVCRLGRLSRQEIRRMRVLETEVQVQVSRASSWGPAAAAGRGGEVRRSHGPD